MSLVRASRTPYHSRAPRLLSCVRARRSVLGAREVLDYLHGTSPDAPTVVVGDGESVESLFLLWGASVFSHTGQLAARDFQAFEFPFVGAYIMLPGNKCRPIAQFEQPADPGAVLDAAHFKRWLVSVANDAARTKLEGLRAEANARLHDRRLREEQEERYHAALEAEADRHRRDEAEAERKELEDAIHLSREYGKELSVQEARARMERHPEPPAPTTPAERRAVTMLRFTLPDGTRVERRFLPSDTIAVLRDYLLTVLADLELHDLAHAFDFGSTLTRRIFQTTDDPKTLADAGLHPQAVIFVSSRVDESLSGSGGDAAAASSGSASDAAAAASSSTSASSSAVAALSAGASASASVSAPSGSSTEDGALLPPATSAGEDGDASRSRRRPTSAAAAAAAAALRRLG